MPISAESTKVSVDFEYVWENASGEEIIYTMRLQHNEDGPIISIFNEGNQLAVLPATMFSEVADFLVKQGALRGVNAPISLGRNMPMPTINRKPKEEVIPKASGRRISKQGLNVEPVTTFTPAATDEGDEGPTPVEPPEETPEEVTGDTAAVIAERMRNRAQVNLEKMEKKKIKTR